MVLKRSRAIHTSRASIGLRLIAARSRTTRPKSADQRACRRPTCQVASQRRTPQAPCSPRRARCSARRARSWVASPQRTIRVLLLLLESLSRKIRQVTIQIAHFLESCNKNDQKTTLNLDWPKARQIIRWRRLNKAVCSCKASYERRAFSSSMRGS